MNSKKIVSSTTKITSAVFLSVVLIAGTIALSFPSFMIGVQAQSYYGMDDGYGSSDYGNDNRYNSYEQDYERDNGRKSYDNSYKSQYQSYKPDYKPKYSSYDGKDDRRDKSQDSSKSVSINKLNCINTNLNINGNNTGDINLGNKGGVEKGGYLGAYSSAGGGYSDERNNNGYYDGYNNKQGKGFDCIINNNNTNVVLAGGGNVTDGNGNVTEPQTCEECFRAFLNADQISAYLTLVNPSSPPTLEELCNDVGPGGIFDLSESAFRTNLANPSVGLSEDDIELLIACLENVGIEFSP